MEKKRAKRRVILLRRDNASHYSARVGYGRVWAKPDLDHWYEPTRASAIRLARIMERILDSKVFWWARVRPGSLMIRLQGTEEL